MIGSINSKLSCTSPTCCDVNISAPPFIRHGRKTEPETIIGRRDRFRSPFAPVSASRKRCSQLHGLMTSFLDFFSPLAVALIVALVLTATGLVVTPNGRLAVPAVNVRLGTDG